MKSRIITVALVLAAAQASTREVWAQSPSASGAPTAAPAYTLEVDSDASSVVSYDALAARLSSELHARVERASGTAPSRAAITITYRKDSQSLLVRAKHAGGRVLERSIVAQGDDASVQAEAVLLASNLARDEARELLDELASRPAPPQPAAPAAERPTPPAAPEERWIGTFGLLYPVATNAGHPNVRSALDLSILYGRIGRSDAFQMSFGVAHASRSATGLQLAAVPISGGSLDGAQLGLGATIALGPVSGAQLGTGASIAGDSVDGAQLSVGVAYAHGPVTGVQASAGFNYAGGLDGAQLAAGGNIARGPVSGAQLSAGFNLATKEVSGAQVTAGVNIATDRLEGAQAGIVNVGGEVSGAQLGLVNVGRRVKGLQLGLVNIAEEVDGVAIGVATITKDSIHPIVWASNLADTNAGIKFTTKYIYTLAAVGLSTLEADFKDGPSVTTALGTHIPIAAGFDVEAEAAYSQIGWKSWENHALHPRVLAGYSFARHLRVFAGGGPRVPLAFDKGSSAVRPEIMAGVQF
jgi:hypothetical protein